MSKSQLIVALDFDELDDALALVDAAGDGAQWYKVGKQLFTRFGPETVRQLKARDKQVFLDLKFHDIPNTVGQAVRSAIEIGADMVNVHASGGRAMLTAAAEAGRDSQALVIAVTVLTSMDQTALSEIGLNVTPAEQVRRLALLARDCGLHGVVASAHEIAAIREACGPDFQQVIPGIRPGGSAADDQKRIMTPAQAVAAGAQFLVVGRPITKAPDPAAAAREIRDEMAHA